MQNSRVEHSQCLFRIKPTHCFAVVSNSWHYSSGNEKENANSEQDGHLLPGVIDQQHMVEQMLSYGIKCQGGAAERSDGIFLKLPMKFICFLMCQNEKTQLQ